jgi:dihydrofolate reductase
LEALLLGRKTYEIFATYWPKQPSENPIAARLNGAPKYVASRTLDAVVSAPGGALVLRDGVNIASRGGGCGITLTSGR